MLTSKKIYVFVLNKHGQPLMPCSPEKARTLLKTGKARVVNKNIFTIQLIYGSSGHKQHVVGGCDTGSKKTAFAVIANESVIYQSEVELRNNIHEKMEQRAMFRRNRRSRKTRYRKARFNNRGRRDGWLTPTLISKVNSHLREKKFIESVLPIKLWNVELAEFDIHKIKNPDVSGVTYQEGRQKDFYNIKQYVLHRDNYQCQHCTKSKKIKNEKLHVHHIVFKSNGGTDNPDNLITLCKSCHKNLHDGLIKIKSGNVKQTKHATEISIVKTFIEKSGWIFNKTFGYETKFKREQVLGIPKTHTNDAVAICCAEGEVVNLSNCVIYKKHVCKGDYQLCKGKRGEIKIPVGKLFGLKKFDYISTDKGVGFVKGKRSTGHFAISDIFGNKISDSVNIKKNCKRLVARTTTLIEHKLIKNKETKVNFPPTNEFVGFQIK